MLEIRPFGALGTGEREEAAHILMRALAHVPSAYHTIEEANAEVEKVARDDRLGIAAIRDRCVVGWIGAIKVYEFGWELHPLVVHPDCQRSGIGTKLVCALEERARQEGVLTLFLGTDDDFGGTNLFGADLYPDPPARLAGIAAVKGHPFTFYRRAGFVLAGVLPDVNGRGKPDILMTKRIA